MYNPSRGGVRGGADQFTWESVKTDKHRENYLGHSLKAPVGRSLKGKDITWYAKERKDVESTKSIEKSELAAIKRAEQEAMLIALGHNVVKKESQELTKEEMTEALKRSVGDRDDFNIERVGGVGARSKAAHLTGSRNKNEGVVFETRRERAVADDNYKEQSPPSKKMKSKKSKKHKKEKKRSHNRNDSEDSEDESIVKKKHRSEKSKKYNDTSDSETENVSKHKHKKEKKLKKKENSSYSDDSNSGKRYKEQSSKKDRDVYDSCESDNQSSSRKKHKRHHDLSDINSSKTKHKKKSKHRHHNSNDSENDSHRTSNKRHRNQENDVHLKRHHQDTSESD